MFPQVQGPITLGHHEPPLEESPPTPTQYADLLDLLRDQGTPPDTVESEVEPIAFDPIAFLNPPPNLPMAPEPPPPFIDVDDTEYDTETIEDTHTTATVETTEDDDAEMDIVG